MDISIVTFPLLFIGIICALVASDTRMRLPAIFSMGFAVAALVVVFLDHQSPTLPMAVAGILVLSSGGYALAHRNLPIGVPIILTLIALVLGLHLLPGLPQYMVFDHEIISHRYPHSLSIVGNFDKGVAGLAVLLMTMRWPARNVNSGVGIYGWWRVPVVVLVMVVIALLSGSIKFDPKWSSHIGRFIISNALLTCAAEEALFRGALFGYIRTLLPATAVGSWATILATSVPFALVHTGDVSYLLLVLSVGMGCGWVRERTGHISAAFAAHALINAVHITLLSYPSI